MNMLKYKWLKFRRVSFIIFIVGIMAISLPLTPAIAVFENVSLRKVPIYSVETQNKQVAISFDCAYGADYTAGLVEVMNDFNVNATFFMVEFFVNEHEDMVKMIDDNGFEIGTHSSTHRYMSKLTLQEVNEELENSSLAIEKITGKTVNLFRPPYGDYDNQLIDACFAMDIFPIQWSVDSHDWMEISASEITLRVTSRVENGSIVLFHNQGLHTLEALPLILASLITSGYTVTSIGDLIYKTDYQINANGKQIKN